jgi:carboxyl-terminal processing protease
MKSPNSYTCGQKRLKPVRIHTLTLIIISIAVFSPGIVQASQSQPSENSNFDMGIIARVTANILSTKQFRKHPIDDELSKQLFKEYFNMLDPGKIYFTKEDVKSFEPYKTDLDDELLSGDISVAFRIYDLLIKRMEEYQKFANSTIEKGFDYTKNESYTYDRKKAERPTKENQKELWRKQLKYDLLSLKMLDKTISDEKIKDKKEAEKRKVANLWKKTPEERLKKRIDTLMITLKKRRNIDRLQFFLAALAQIYDPHSTYMAPKIAENFDISMKNSLVGIGAVLTIDDGYTKIVSIIKGGPAEKDGHLEPEDRIIAVAQGNNEPVDIIDMPLDDVVHLIRGKKDTIVKLHVMKGRNGGHSIPEIITIKRDKVELKDQDAQEEICTVEVDGMSKKIGIINLPSFYINFKDASNHVPNYKSCTRDIKTILGKFTRESVDGVIIDLRYNGGGSLREAILLTGLFIENGPIVQVKSAENNIPQVESDFDKKCYYSGPLIVLTSKFSASAAEIFAAAIQDYGRGIIIGEAHTHGKGTVQTILELNKLLKHFGLKSDPGNLKITIAKFYRINGESTQMKGVEPDIVIPSLTDARELGEKYLDHALPWDTIKPAHYSRTDLTGITNKLNKLSKKRRAEDPKFQELKKMIVMYKNILNRKTISLNEAERWEEYQDDKKIFDKQDAMLNKNTKDDEKSKINKPNDVTLQESIRIMQDWLKEKNSK